MPRKKKEPTVPEKEPIVFTFEPFDEKELKDVIETSEKTLSRNYVFLVLLFFTLLTSSLSLFFISQNIKQSRKDITKVQNLIVGSNKTQNYVKTSVDSLTTSVSSIQTQMNDVNSELQNINQKLKRLNKIRTLLDTLVERTKSN